MTATTLTPLIVETLEEIVAAGDAESAAQASRLLRFHEAVHTHSEQQAFIDATHPPARPRRGRRRAAMPAHSSVAYR